MKILTNILIGFTILLVLFLTLSGMVLWIDISMHERSKVLVIYTMKDLPNQPIRNVMDSVTFKNDDMIFYFGGSTGTAHGISKWVDKITIQTLIK